MEEHTEAGTAAAAIPHYNNPEGTIVLKKQDADEEYFCFPTAKRKGHKRQKDKKHDARAIKHDAHTMKLFASLSLDVPMSVEACRTLTEQLEERLAEHSLKLVEEEMRNKQLAVGNKDRPSIWRQGPTWV